MRNPVTNIATMVTATDIADWCYAESLGSYDFTKFRGPTQEQLFTMYEKSPIIHVDKVKTPTLLALGMVDLRVPPSQGKEWYYTLRSAGVDTELLVYPKDCHALDRVTTEADHWIHIKQWFDKYMMGADD
jgi:acylaminoacyl-peptidase